MKFHPERKTNCVCKSLKAQHDYFLQQYFKKRFEFTKKLYQFNNKIHSLAATLPQITEGATSRRHMKHTVAPICSLYSLVLPGA